jgi:hypothetical protein
LIIMRLLVGTPEEVEKAEGGGGGGAMVFSSNPVAVTEEAIARSSAALEALRFFQERCGIKLNKSEKCDTKAKCAKRKQKVPNESKKCPTQATSVKRKRNEQS